MAEIEIVIKIPEEKYLYAKNLVNGGKETNPVVLAVGNGIALPKGHGDLIDRRELIKNGVSRGFCDWYDEIKYAETIIKADDKNKAEKEPDTEPDLEV